LQPATSAKKALPSLGRAHLQVRVAVIGNVDSGKSTLVGVLTRSILDDGRGLARAKVFKVRGARGCAPARALSPENAW
jgi:GTPase